MDSILLFIAWPVSILYSNNDKDSYNNKNDNNNNNNKNCDDDNTDWLYI